MLHHHDEEDSETVETANMDYINSRRRHSHGHIHLNPTTVFDHIKTKVKRKRNLHHGPKEIPPFVRNGNLLGGQSIISRQELEMAKPLRGTHSQSIISSPKLSDHSDVSSESKVQEENRLSLDNKYEMNPVFSDSAEKENEPYQSVQWRLQPLESDNENNNNNSKGSKSKLNKLLKTKSETTLQPNIKKGRQNSRHTVDLSSKTDLNKKKKGNDLSDLETLPYLTSFQIRDDDFHNIFKDLPSDEQLISGYPCAWRKDIFMHGRLFLTVNYLCFYACFFKWDESLCIDYKDIVSVTREKSAKLIPNAIQIRTKNREQYIFASYIPRERIYIAIFRLWQNALLEKPLDYQQLKAIVFADQINLDESTGDSDESIGKDNSEEHSSSANMLPVFREKPRRTTSTVSNQIEDKHQASISLGLESATYLSACPCETHFAKTYAERSFTILVDHLFDLAFGDNPFTRAYHESQKLLDYTIGDWHRNPETGKRERQVSYKTVTQSILGTNTINCNEKQMVEMEKPHSIYILNSEVFNEGMKYTDAFYLTTRFCMYQCDVKSTFLRVTGEVHYVKSVNAIAKSFIEKNCHSSVEEGVNDLVRRLDNYQTKSDERSSIVTQKHVHKKKIEQKDSDETKDESIVRHSPVVQNQILINEPTLTGKGFLFDLTLFLGILFLILHLYLCWKLYHIDQALSDPNHECEIVCRKD